MFRKGVVKNLPATTRLEQSTAGGRGRANRGRSAHLAWAAPGERHYMAARALWPAHVLGEQPRRPHGRCTRSGDGTTLQQQMQRQQQKWRRQN